MQFTAQQSAQLLDLAREVIRLTLAGKVATVRMPTEPALHQPAGAFVSLHALQTHRLRGCVGRLDTTQPACQTVAAVSQSVLEDPRFASEPVRLAELPSLSVEITLLAPLKPAKDILDFDLLNDGIYLTFDNRSGCFLPQVARETGWSKQQLLDRLCVEKLGVPAQSWTQPQASLQKFTTLLIGPAPFVG